MHLLKNKKTQCTLLLTGITKSKKNPDTSGFTRFVSHIEMKNKKFTDLEVLKHLFLPAHIDNLIDEEKNGENINIPRSYTKCIDKDYIFHHENKEYIIPVKYLDLFIFPDDVMIYSIKTELHNLPVSLIPVFNHKIRIFDFEKDSVFEEIFNILNYLSADEQDKMTEYTDFLHLVTNGNKLKSYILLLEDFKYPKDYTRDNLMFDLGTCSALGSSTGVAEDKKYLPSKSYYEAIIEKGKISVFDDWSALSTNDSFVYIQNNNSGAGLNIFQWEHLYYRFIYLNAIYIYNYLFEINKAYRKEKYDKNLLHKFLDFDKKYILEKISYNFLPNLVYEKINTAMEIEKELQQLHYSIDKESIKRDRISNNKLNAILLIIAVLSMLSAFKDWSDWLVRVNFAQVNTFPYFLFSLLPSAIGILLIFFIGRRSK